MTGPWLDFVQLANRKLRTYRGAIEVTSRTCETRSIVVSRYHPQVYGVSIVENTHVLTPDVRDVLERTWQTVFLWSPPALTRFVPVAIGYEVTGRVLCQVADPADEPIANDNKALTNSLYECVTDWEPVLAAVWVTRRKAVTTLLPPPMPRSLATTCDSKRPTRER